MLIFRGVGGGLFFFPTTGEMIQFDIFQMGGEKPPTTSKLCEAVGLGNLDPWLKGTLIHLGEGCGLLSMIHFFWFTLPPIIMEVKNGSLQ